MTNGEIEGNIVPAQFTVMTYNIGNGLVKPERLAALLQGVPADIVALQEVTRAQAEALKSAERDYAYQAVHGSGIPGKAILSRFKIVETEPLVLYPERPDFRVTLEVQSRRLNVFIAHPLPPRIHSTGFHFKHGTRTQIMRLGEMASTGDASVLMGDFNMTDQHEQYAMLRQRGLTDAFRAAGRGAGLTLPLRWGGIRLIPVVRVDYIWHSAHFNTHAAWLGQDAGSDHVPVLARLGWRETP
jgi:endonuclease/exonuclease/phosphatase family metal-dependent hydrolase